MSQSFSINAVKTMKNMATDPKKRSALMQDSTIIGGLIMVLSNSNQDLVRLALETLILLSETKEHRMTLRNFLGLMAQVETISLSHKCTSENRRLAASLQHFLRGNVDDFPNSTPLKDSKNSNNLSINASKSFTSKPVKARSTVLQLRGLIDKHDKDVVTRLLVQVKGVISITIDPHKSRCYIRSRLETKPEQLVLAVSKSQTITAQHVTRDDQGQEILVSYGVKDLDTDKENCELPSYLPDDVENSPIADEKAIARLGQQKKSKGWFSSAASFLTNSFYW